MEKEGRAISAPGPVLFARYAYPPNALGYCGPADAAEVLGALGGSGADRLAPDVHALELLAREFDGAWPYLAQIAAWNGISDPLDAAVVEAYWLGNPLALRVPPASLDRALDERFGGRLGVGSDVLRVPLGLGAVLTHSFHVFAVSPWLGLLRRGASVPALTVLDRCRIRWGRVRRVDGETAEVKSRPLVLAGSRLELGPVRVETARVAAGGTVLGPVVGPGDVVALHWDWVCDRVSAGQVAWLQRCTARNLAAVNGAPVPGPAAACDAGR